MIQDTIYKQLTSFFSSNPNKEYTFIEITKHLPSFNSASIRVTMSTMARSGLIIPVYPRRWKWNN